MALVLKDRVKETCTGTSGDMALTGAVSGYVAFDADATFDGNTTYYALEDADGTKWEVGLGTLSADSTTLTRTTILATQASFTDTTRQTFSSGTHTIYCVYPAGKSVHLDGSGVLSHSIVNADISNSAAIAIAKLASSSIGVSDGSSTTEISLGQDIQFRGTSNEVEVAEASGTITVGLPSSITANVTGDLTGNADTATNATNATHVAVADNESTDENNLITFIEDASATGNVGLESDGDFHYNPSTGTVTATIFKGNIDAVDGDFDGTLEADAITIGGTALNTVIAGVTVANATNAVTATNANHVAVADNESTDENNLIPFIEDASATGNVGLESDGDFHYNPSSGTITATIFKGNIDAVDGDFDGTLEADAITVGGVALNTVIAGVTVTNATNATNAVTATNANHVAVADNESTDENNLITFIEDASATGNVGLESDGDFHYNPSTGTVTATIFKGNIDAVDGDFDGTLEADAITIGGTALNTVIAGVTVANATNAVTATNANHVAVADNESTDENNLIPFIEDASATGNVGLESDGDFHYNPSSGTVTATIFKGNIDAVDGTLMEHLKQMPLRLVELR